MESQEFSGSFEPLDGHDTTEVSASSEALEEPLIHRIPIPQDEPAEPEEQEEPGVSQEAHEQGQQDEWKEIPEPHKRYKSHSLSEPHEHYEPRERYESYEVYESYKFRAPREPHEPRESYKTYESYEPYEVQAPCKPQEPQAPRELHKLRAPCKPRRPQAPHKAHKSHEAGLLPSSALMSPSLVIRFPPWIPWSSLNGSVPRDFVRKCVSSRKRIHDLSKPKKQWGTPDRKLFWGNQDPIRPVCHSALKTQMTKRLETLAWPKEVSYRYIPNRAQYYYSCGRESVIWDIPSSVLLTKPSRRIQELAQPNRFKIMNLTDRSLPDYVPRKPLQLSGPSARILRLSMARSTHPNYVPPKGSETRISVFTLNAVASPRTVDLAHPRIKIEGLCYPTERSEVPIRPISQAALLAKASPRITALAEAKTLHQDYLPPRDPHWPVSYAAMHSKASARVQELANPNIRTPVHIVYYDPQVFKVKPAALKSQCSQRIQELAEPLTR